MRRVTVLALSLLGGIALAAPFPATRAWTPARTSTSR